MTETKDFHLGDVLSVTTGLMLSPRHMEGLYDILNWMSGDNLFTHQLPRVGGEAKSVLLSLYPRLSKDQLKSDIDYLLDILKEFDDKTERKSILLGWLDNLSDRVGLIFAIPRMNEDQHQYIDPMSELAEKIHPDRIIKI